MYTDLTKPLCAENIHHHDSNAEQIEINESLKSKSGAEYNSADNSKLSRFAVKASWAVNWFLLVVKLYAAIQSSSKAVMAALVDSAVDLVSQAVLALADQYMSRHSPDYPVGRSRLEALSVIACAFIMSMASIEVVQYSAVDLYNGIHGNIPLLYIGMELYIILCIGIFLKFLLWLFCAHVNKTLKSDMIEALTEDHLNDVLSNSVAIITAAIAYHTTAWWVDATGAILISTFIIYRWIGIIYEQVKKIVGYTAPPEFIEQLEELALQHDFRLSVDCTRVYHFGARYNVEMEVVLPGIMTVMESHDIALALQHKIENFADVERAFVHVDHQKRDGLEHKVERELALSSVSDNTDSGEISPVNPNQQSEIRIRNFVRHNSDDV